MAELRLLFTLKGELVNDFLDEFDELTEKYREIEKNDRATKR